MRDATGAEAGSRHCDGTASLWHRWQIGPAGAMLYPTCTQLLIVQLPATGARGLSHGVLLNSDHPSWLWLPNSLEGAGGGGHPTCPVGPMPTSPRGQKGISRQRSMCQPGVSAACRGSLPCWHRPCQQPWGWLKLSRALLLVSITVVCLLLTAPAHCSLIASF